MMQFKTIVQIFCLLIHFNGGLTSEWSYTGNLTNPLHWTEHDYPSCGAAYQSPIDIIPAETILDKHLKRISISMNATYNMSEQTYSVTNNGHTLKIAFPDDMWYISLSGSNLSRYSVVQMHFHWGSSDDHGSEHTLNGKTYSMESHLVAYDSILYRSYTAASTSPFGHAVLGFWSEVSTSAEVSQTQIGLMGQLGDEITNGLGLEDTITIEAFNLSNLLDQVNPALYYRYEGSLTTPPCTQNVIWTVFTTVVPVLQSQLDSLRKNNCSSAESQTVMADNYRPVLPLDPEEIPVRRSVFRSGCNRLLANNLATIILFSTLWYIS